MLVFVGVIAITATVACGAPCPEVDEDGLVNCADQNLTTVPQIPEGVIKLYVGNIKISVRSREQMSVFMIQINVAEFALEIYSLRSVTLFLNNKDIVLTTH